MKNKFTPIIKFICVGLSNNLIFYLIYMIALQMKVYYMIANITAYLISSLWGYLINGKWVFQSSHFQSYKTVVRYYVVYINSFLINIVLLFLLVDKLYMSEIIAPIIILFVTVPLNFFFCKFWVYAGEINKK